VGTCSGAAGSAASSNFAECHAPLDGLAICSLDNPIQLHHIHADRYPKMRRDIFGGWDDADTFRSATERQAITL
jgi:hypothetical protein